MSSASIDLFEGVLLFLILMASISLHEWAHSRVADKLGDPSPRLDGRTSLNPAVHFDPLGTFLFPLIFIFVMGSKAPFGWGRRIILNPDNFRNPTRDELYVWFAGPACNAAIALVAAVLGGLTTRVFPRFYELMEMFIRINALLIIINLLPVPPLDGGYILKRLTNMSEEMFMRLSMFCFFILLVIFLFPPTERVVNFAFSSTYAFFFNIMRMTAGFVA